MGANQRPQNDPRVMRATTSALAPHHGHDGYAHQIDVKKMGRHRGAGSQMHHLSGRKSLGGEHAMTRTGTIQRTATDTKQAGKNRQKHQGQIEPASAQIVIANPSIGW